MIKLFIIIIFFSSSTLSREVGQTEITTDEGIEVFQNEKYYLLKNNVQIISDDFQLDIRSINDAPVFNLSETTIVLMEDFEDILKKICMILLK